MAADVSAQGVYQRRAEPRTVGPLFQPPTLWYTEGGGLPSRAAHGRQPSSCKPPNGPVPSPNQEGPLQLGTGTAPSTGIGSTNATAGAASPPRAACACAGADAFPLGHRQGQGGGEGQRRGYAGGVPLPQRLRPLPQEPRGPLGAHGRAQGVARGVPGVPLRQRPLLALLAPGVPRRDVQRQPIQKGLLEQQLRVRRTRGGPLALLPLLLLLRERLLGLLLDRSVLLRALLGVLSLGLLLSILLGGLLLGALLLGVLLRREGSSSAHGDWSAWGERGRRTCGAP